MERRSESSEVSPVRILSVAPLHWKQDHETAVMAVALLAHRGVDLVWTIIGDGPERKAVEFAVRDCGIEERVVLSEAPVGGEIASCMLDADVFLDSSVAEGSGNAVGEAMAAGLPVVVADAPGTKELVSHGIDGLLFARRDFRAAAEALLKVATDREAAVSLGNAARAGAESGATVGTTPFSRHSRRRTTE